MRRTAAVLLLAMACTMAYSKGELTCHEQEGTRRWMCIAPYATTVNGDVRASPLYMGGPNNVNRANFVIITNCKTGATTLQDRDGVNFAGGLSSVTETSQSLSRYLCEVKSPKQDRRLRQF